MCDQTKSAVETVREAIADQNWRLSDIRSDIIRYKENAKQARETAKQARARAAMYRNDARIARERLREEREVMKALRAELRELKPSKPRKAKGFPVTEYFEPSPARELVTADFERYSNGFNVYD
jgi:chromosome segregation ATPase